jgi:hypothetical protein
MMRESALAVGGAALAAICCLAVPITAGAIGGVTLAAVAGWGALVVAGVAVSVLVIARVRRAPGKRGDRS